MEWEKLGNGVRCSLVFSQCFVRFVYDFKSVLVRLVWPMIFSIKHDINDYAIIQLQFHSNFEETDELADLLASLTSSYEKDSGECLL